MGVYRSTGDSNTNHPLPGGIRLVSEHRRYLCPYQGIMGEASRPVGEQTVGTGD